MDDQSQQAMAQCPQARELALSAPRSDIQPWVVCRAEMPIEGNALRMARQLLWFWLAREKTITLEIWGNREPGLTFRRSDSAGESNG